MGNQMVLRAARVGALSMLIGSGVAGASYAADTTDAKGPRYTLQKVDDGFVRLDTKSGDVAFCSKVEGKWGCRSMDENGGDVRDRIVMLERENDKLRDKIAKLENRPATERDRSLNLPSDEEIDKAMNLVDKMVRRFKDVLNNLKKDDEKGTPL